MAASQHDGKSLDGGDIKHKHDDLAPFDFYYKEKILKFNIDMLFQHILENNIENNDTQKEMNNTKEDRLEDLLFDQEIQFKSGIKTKLRIYDQSQECLTVGGSITGDEARNLRMIIGQSNSAIFKGEGLNSSQEISIGEKGETHIEIELTEEVILNEIKNSQFRTTQDIKEDLEKFCETEELSEYLESQIRGGASIS